MNISDYECRSLASKVELSGPVVRLISLFGDVLRIRSYRGTHATQLANEQASQWSDRFEVPIQ